MGDSSNVELVSVLEAADRLNVSEQYQRRPLAEGALTAVGEGRDGPRLDLADVLAYKLARDARRRAGLMELTRLTEEFGGYGAERDRRAGAERCGCRGGYGDRRG